MSHPVRIGDIEVRVTDGVGTVTIDRPASYNSLTVAVLTDLEAALRSVGRHPDCRVVILAGTGRSFCTGMDLHHALDEGTNDDAVTRSMDAMRVAMSTTVALREIPQPVITAVQGHAIGAGFAYAAASDIRLCGPDARYNAVFARIGMTPGDLGLSWLLPRLIGATHAAELFYTGGILDATTAERLGFVSRVVEDPQAEALALARTMALTPRLVLTQTKELLNASMNVSGFREHLQLEYRCQVICSLTDAHREALDAFRTRRRV